MARARQQSQQPIFRDSSPVLTGRTIFYIGLGLAAVALSLATLRVDPLILIGAVLAIVGLVVVFKYPFAGFFIYVTLYYLRLGERFPAVAPLRLELVFSCWCR
jgi:hypothetical protein